MRTKKARKISALLFLLLCASAVFCVLTGPVQLTDRIFMIRVCRVIFGIIVGAGLAACGTVFQSMLRNPLAEPYVLGVSSGAGLGVVMFATFFGVSAILPVAGFVGAVATIFVVYNLSRIGSKVPAQSMLLSGVVINIVFSSLILFFISIAKRPVLHDVTWWLLGNLQIFDVRLVAAAAFCVLAGIIVFVFYSRELNAIAIGEEEAMHLGIDVEAVKKILFIVTSLITAALVATCGLVGFVGLIVPHIARYIVGPDHKVSIPIAAILGAIFIILGDALGRILVQPTEIPIGVITSFLGGPFFIILLRKSRRIKSI